MCTGRKTLRSTLLYIDHSRPYMAPEILAIVPEEEEECGSASHRAGKRHCKPLLQPFT